MAQNFMNAAARGARISGRRRGSVPQGGAKPNARSAAGRNRMGSAQRGDAGVNFRVQGDEAARIANELEQDLMLMGLENDTMGGADPGRPMDPMQVAEDQSPIAGGVDPAQAGQMEEGDNEDINERRLRFLREQGLI